MARIVILGAGIGGLSVAMELKSLVREEDEVFVISETAMHNFNPANLSVAINSYKAQDIGIELALLLTQHEIGFIQRSATSIIPTENRVELEGGASVDYDYLVIATGPRPAFDEIPGFGPDAFTRSVCRVGEAIEAGKAWEEFVADPGPIVVGTVQGANIFAPAYEYAMLIDTDLRRRNIRDQVSITFVTAEPFIGHLGMGGLTGVRVPLETELRNHDINWIVNAKVERIEKDQILFTEMDVDGQPKQSHQMPFKHCMMMPAYTGVDALRNIDGLVNERGFVLIDKHQRNPNFPNVYAVGVCAEVPNPEKTPVPIGASKNGYMIESMVNTAASNICAVLNGEEPTMTADWRPYRLGPDNEILNDGVFDKKWINPVCGLYAYSIYHQLTDAEQFQ